MHGLHPGECEGLKGKWHLALEVLAFGGAVYNLSAWLVRRERHLLVNGFLYALLTAVEHEQVKHHADRTGSPE